MLQLSFAHCPAAGERAVFQPRSATFQQEVGEDIRTVLEAALLQVRACNLGWMYTCLATARMSCLHQISVLHVAHLTLAAGP